MLREYNGKQSISNMHTMVLLISPSHLNTLRDSEQSKSEQIFCIKYDILKSKHAGCDEKDRKGKQV